MPLSEVETPGECDQGSHAVCLPFQQAGVGWGQTGGQSGGHGQLHSLSCSLRKNALLFLPSKGDTLTLRERVTAL